MGMGISWNTSMIDLHRCFQNKTSKITKRWRYNGQLILPLNDVTMERSSHCPFSPLEDARENSINGGHSIWEISGKFGKSPDT